MFTNLRVSHRHRILLDYLLSNCHANTFIREWRLSHITTAFFVLQMLILRIAHMMNAKKRKPSCKDFMQAVMPLIDLVQLHSETCQAHEKFQFPLKLTTATNIHTQFNNSDQKNPYEGSCLYHLSLPHPLQVESGVFVYKSSVLYVPR